MIMNGVQIEVPSKRTGSESYISSSMSVDENVVMVEDNTMESINSEEEVAPTEVKFEEEMEKLKIHLQNQLEYYFSSENLTRDQYLVSQMDDQHYVPIWTIANFNLVKNLTTDINLITEVLRSSSLVQVDDRNEKVRPNQTKFALILREIPEDTPVESVEGLFEGGECPKFSSCEFAANTSWYVTFDSEADAQAAYRHLREKVKTFLGKPIMARMKSKTLHLNTYAGSKTNQKPQVAMPGQIMSPPYVQSPMNVFPGPQPGPYGPGGQAPPPFITAIPTQPPGSTSPHSSTVVTTAPPAHVYVVPPGPQPWYPSPDHMPHTFANQPFGNAVFHQSMPPQPIPQGYMPGKRNPMYGNKGNYMNNNYLGGDMPPPGRNMQQDNRVMQLPGVNPSAPDSRPPHYLSAVGHPKMQMSGQQSVYLSTVMPPGPYYKGQPPNKLNKQLNGNISNGVNSRYGRSTFTNSYHHDNDISPRFQKKGLQPPHQHQRYSASRSNSHEYTNRHSSEGGVPYHNGPSNMHDSYANSQFPTRNNSTGHDASMVNSSRFGQRQGFVGKFQGADSTDSPNGSYDINNNAAKRQNFNSDTVQNSSFDYRTGQLSQRQRRQRRNGDSRSSSARPSPPAPPLNGPDHPDQEAFNLENTAFPPLPGAAASNAATNPITSSTDSVSKKPQVPEESYKNSLKMNLERVPPSVSTTTNAQPSTIRSHPVAKEEPMQSQNATKEQAQRKDFTIAKDNPNPSATTHPLTSKGANKGPKPVAEVPKPPPPPPANVQTMTSQEKQSKPNHKQTKSNKAETQKGKSEPTKSNTSDKSTVPTAESDAGKKLSYAEMLRKKTAKPVVPVVTDENDNRVEKKSETNEEKPEKPKTAQPSTVSAKPVPEKTITPENGSNKTTSEEKPPPSPTDGSEDSDDKPWESAVHTKRSHRGERVVSDHSQHNGHDTREGGYHHRGGRNGGFSGRGGGPRARGRGRGGYGRGGGRYSEKGYNGRERFNSAGNDRQPTTNAEGTHRKR